MNYFILLFFIVGTAWSRLDANFVRLSALNNSPHALHLYKKLQNESTAPSMTDPAAESAEIRKQICNDLVCNRYFYRTSLELIQAIAIHRDTKHPRFGDVYALMYNLKNDKYTNPYRKLEFIKDDFRFREHVFFCPLSNLSDDDEESTYHFYVSKEYNVGPFDEPYIPGRFMIGLPEFDDVDEIELMLAEEPARTYNQVGFNVELFYLRLRQYIEPAKLDTSDPVCKLLSDQLEDPNNQHFRLCVAALRSPYFEDKVHYPENLTFACHEERVSFRSVEALEEADGEPFKEQMTLCYSEYLDPPDVPCKVYISRAYLSNSIFVYRQDPQDRKIYLEHLSTNVGIVDELNTFDLVEY